MGATVWPFFDFSKIFAAPLVFFSDLSVLPHISNSSLPGMTTNYQCKQSFAAALPMWRRDAFAAMVVSTAKTVRAIVAASHRKGRFTTQEVD